MALLEKEAVRFAESLDDYGHVSVSGIGGSHQSYWVVVRDHRFDLDYEIASHCDYWDFIGASSTSASASITGLVFTEVAGRRLDW